MTSELDNGIVQVASRQHGVVTRGQLLEVGLTAEGVRSRLRSGRLLSLHREVYLIGALRGPLRPERYREMAAVLACGRGAAVSHRSAAWLRGLVAARPRGPVHIVLKVGRCRRIGILAHTVSSLPAADVSVANGIPATGVVRTIMDVAADAGFRELERMVARAERANLLTLEELNERVQRAGGRPGVRLLRALLGVPNSPAFTRSRAEEGMFALAAQGIEVHRVTWRQIENAPFVVVRRLAATLARAEALRGG